MTPGVAVPVPVTRPRSRVGGWVDLMRRLMGRPDGMIGVIILVIFSVLAMFPNLFVGPLETAITAPRFHIETAEPVHVEDGADALAAGLVDRGHRVNWRAPFGAMQAIQLDPHTGEMTGVADPRRAGTTLWT